MTMTTYRVRDGARYLEFDGEQLARATSDDGRAQRWTELTAYRTESGRYVLEKVGRSLVYHAEDSTCTRGETVANTELHEDAVPCLNCGPGDPVDGVWFIKEVDRFSATVADTAAGLVELARNRDRDTGVLFLPNLAIRLLDEASDRDPELEHAFKVQRI